MNERLQRYDIPIGSLVERVYGGFRGIVIESWPPTVYDGRTYMVLWQRTGQKSAVYANEIRLVEQEDIP